MDWSRENLKALVTMGCSHQDHGGFPVSKKKRDQSIDITILEGKSIFIMLNLC